MGRVAIVTDTAADLTPADARRTGIVVVPLTVTFGTDTFRGGIDLSTEDFWRRMTAPDAPFPKTAAPSAGEFKTAFEGCFAAGADAIVCVDVGSSLSGTYQSAVTAAGLLPGREIHVVDSGTASMGVGLLAFLGAEMAEAGESAASIASAVRSRTVDVDLFVGLDTLEYLKRGGRISGSRAAVGTLLQVKPIITVRDGVVEQADRVRTRSKVRARVIELLAATPVERVAILHTMSDDVESFRTELLDRLSVTLSADRLTVQPIGPSVGPHIGPGALGAVVLRRR